ncbi:TrkH family potassium uptake protein [soil metagenome]
MSEEVHRYDRVLRRRVRESQYIEVPQPVAPPKNPGVRDRAKRFALILLAIMLVGAALLATPLTTRSGDRTSAIDALFTSVSAVAVTGLVTVDTATHWNILGQVIILLLMQIGGLGFMVGAGILFQLSRGGRTTLHQSLFLRDGSPSISLREASEVSKHIALFTFAVEGVGWLILSICFSREMPLGSAIWHGLFHSVSAFCNAGFDLQGNFQSLTPFKDSLAVNVTVAVLVLTGALSFLVVRDVAGWLHSMRKGIRRQALGLDAKLVLSGNVVLFIIGFVALLLLEWNGMLEEFSGPGRFFSAAFQALAGRTSGFATVEWESANAITQFVWLALMMVGGASGSTAGGVKIATVAIIFVSVLSTFRGEDESEVFQRRLSAPLVMRAMSVVAVFLLIHFLGTIVLAFTEFSLRESDTELNRLFFETMSALATVGLSAGITREMTDVGKFMLCLMMFIGRLGPLTLGYALQMRTHPHRYRFPEGDIRIG